MRGGRLGWRPRRLLQYTQSPSYQTQMERLAQQHMFSKDQPEEAETEAAAAPESSEQKVPEE